MIALVGLVLTCEIVLTDKPGLGKISSRFSGKRVVRLLESCSFRSNRALKIGIGGVLSCVRVSCSRSKAVRTVVGWNHGHSGFGM